jgi:hypothetical protein
VAGYVGSYSGDCSIDGDVVLSEGDEKICYLTNDDLSANITLIKNVVNDNGGTAIPTSFILRIDGGVVPNNTSIAVSANTPHSINEDSKAGYSFVSITGSAKCPGVLGGTATLDEGEAITCTITNNDNAVLTENFGDSGTCVTDIPGWAEDAGESCVNGTVSKNPGAGDDTASPDGGNFGLLSGNNGFICRDVNATGLQNLQLKYYWRGDSAGDPGETGTWHIYSGGTCGAPIGEVASTTHALTTTVWSALQTVNLPASLNNDSSIIIKFTANSNAGNESWRLDGISITGTAI